MNPVDLRLYGILGPDQARHGGLADLVAQAVAGGATLIQYRDKTSGTRTMVETARSLKKALAGSGVPLLINDRVDVALAAEADGVHVGQDDMAVVDARRLLGGRAIIGLTLKSEDEARAVAGLPLDYVCIGGVFATASKDNPAPPIGLSGLARVAAAARRAAPGVPAGAIAGIGPENAASVIGAGADGIALIAALFGTGDPAGAARRLRGIVDGALAARGASA